MRIYGVHILFTLFLFIFAAVPANSDSWNSFLYGDPTALNISSTGAGSPADAPLRLYIDTPTPKTYDMKRWPSCMRQCLRDGALCFAPEGESSTDLGSAQLFAWRRRA